MASNISILITYINPDIIPTMTPTIAYTGCAIIYLIKSIFNPPKKVLEPLFLPYTMAVA